jgi:hypothetical protein
MAGWAAREAHFTTTTNRAFLPLQSATQRVQNSAMRGPAWFAALEVTVAALSPVWGQTLPWGQPSANQVASCPCSPLPRSAAGSALCPDNKWMSRLGVGEYRSVRDTDFANFSFPWLSMSQGTFHLTAGSLSPTRRSDGVIEEVGLDLFDVLYGDVTGDGLEEAIVVLTMTTGGSAVPHWVYVYSPARAQPSLIWAFETGDRADEGLRKVSADKGDLLLELHDPEDSRGDCCPVLFTRARYRWAGARFCLRGERQTIGGEDGLVRVGRIHGIAVHPDGSPALGAVEVEPVDASVPPTIAFISRKDGAFASEMLPAGRYRVGVDLGINRQPDEAYGKSYYPGTTDPAEAIEIKIDVHLPEQTILFTVPKLRPTVELRGAVVYEDGRPAPGVNVLFSPIGGYSTAQVWTDSKGNFSETKYGSIAYRVWANSRDGGYESRPEVIAASDLGKPILLVLHRTNPEPPKQPLE